MALTPSVMISLGASAPDFALNDCHGKPYRLIDFANSKALLIVFMCNHCPYVRHVQPGLVQLAKDLQSQGVAVVGINANDSSSYPEDSPANMQRDVEKFGYTFPYLVDHTQEVAQAYQAACTPDFFLYDSKRRLVYRGQMDDSRPGNGVPVTGQSIRTAVKHLLAGEPISHDQKPSMGCNIKWKP